MSYRSQSATHRILLFIREHPEGVRRKDIIEAFPLVPKRNFDGTLNFLRKSNLVVKDEVKQGLWYPKTDDGIQSSFSEIASDLIAELREIHYAEHEMYLARRLQEIFE